MVANSALAAVVAACAHFQARESAIPIRVVTYNIRAGNGDLQRTVETIRRLAPDIVGLQEVDVNWGERSGFEDQARSLGESLGMHVRFAPIYTLPGADSTKPARRYGVAVLSKHPIVRWRNDTLTRLSTIAPDPAPAPGPGLLDATIASTESQCEVQHPLDYRSDPLVRNNS